MIKKNIKYDVLITDEVVVARKWLSNIDSGPLIFYEHDGIRLDQKCDCIVDSLDTITDSFVEKIYQRHNRIPWEIAQTDRLIIREYTVSDVENLPHQLYWDKEFVTSYISTMYEIWGFGQWLIVDKESGNFVGRAGIGITDELEARLELGYEIIPDYRRKGLAFEACCAIIKYCYQELNIDELVCRIQSENFASIELCKKLILFCSESKMMKIIIQIQD